MNDRFKFRVWDVQHQKYLDFDLLDKESLNDFSYFATDETPDYNEQIIGSGNTCWALIIEQCTSLKDKNGNLIYEGDIISDFKYGVNCVVKFGVLNFKKVSEYDGSIRDVTCECFYFTELETGKVLNVFRQSHNIPGNDWKIIGNIHENGDLLK